ncbi:group II intron maturase-specific domain-containing protein [Massilia genomosp. 1]|uniref:group II intron maturase-specific domain-containing protein n=1 Tax=Massilia genomosp. 1 TaxID=2609280 RepID=UPI0035A2AF3A
MTSRTCGRSINQVIEQLRRYVLGWKAYFNLAQTPGVWRKPPVSNCCETTS